MSAKIMFRILYVLTALASLAACGSVPVAASTQPTVKPTLTVVSPTPVQKATQVISAAITPKPTESVLTATRTEQFIGTWKFSIYGNPLYVHFKPDGNFNLREADPPPGDPGFSGKFTFDGKIFTIETDECPGVIGKYEAPQIYQQAGVNSKITFKVIEDTCEGRVHDYQKGFTWLIPQPE